MKIKIIANPKKAWAKALAKKISDFLSQKHIIVTKEADATVCIGGDGTVLYAGHNGDIEGAVLGIGGDTSYICQIHHKNWKESVKILESKKFEKIMTLNCEVSGKSYRVLNDIVVHATHYRVVEMGVKTKGRIYFFEGDGMIISSPVGSTAYAFSAGGRKFKPKERNISVVPICAYKRAFLPLVLSENEKVSIKAGSDCAFILDGIFIRNLKPGEVVNIRKGSDMIFFNGVGKNE
ncbi:MAG: hypothetical protein ABH842_03245 [Candidatus Micrarchaeota archaeon]